MSALDTLLGVLSEYKYFAMFGILVLCGTGLPLPEELTLIASGLAVGWKEANFFLASLACVLGILAGDALIFALGRYWGKWFLSCRPMQWILTPRRQARVRRLFAKHGTKAVFFARFFAGVRIGVYAYAGQHGMKWMRFLCLDLMGALVSGPTSIWIGKFAAERLADPEDARNFAVHLIHKGTHWLYIGFGVLVLLVVARWLWSRRGEKSRAASPASPAARRDEGQHGRVTPVCVQCSQGSRGPQEGLH